MSAPPVIDGLEFARSGQQLCGSLPVRDLGRLEDLLHDASGSLDYELKGTRDARNRPQLALKVVGRLHLQCQRCLGLLDYSVDVVNILLVVPRDAHFDEDMNDPEAPDAVEAGPELEVTKLIEEEVLLSLPFAPRHHEGACASRLKQHEKGESKSAFAELASLKTSHKR
jgi:uncharacterized protein